MHKEMINGHVTKGKSMIQKKKENLEKRAYGAQEALWKTVKEHKQKAQRKSTM